MDALMYPTNFTRMRTFTYIIAAVMMMVSSGLYAQGLEGIVVEKYYSSNAADAADATAQGAIVPLTAGSVTYRVYVDMAAGYKFSQVYGSAAHNLIVSSSANFYNDANWGVSLDPGTISTTNIRKNTGMIDSYFTCGGTAVGKVGVPKIEDVDGSLGNAQSILANNPGSCFGSPINGSGAKDGFATATAGTYLAPNSLGLGSSLDVLDQTAGNSIIVTDGAIAALGGVVGATASNMVLIGQFTTTGTLSFSFNVQVVNIATGVAENYVPSSAGAGEVVNATLSQTVEPSCPFIGIGNDTPAAATLVQYNTNSNFPNCVLFTGTTATATNSSESAATGPDRWYRFVAQSTAVSITLTSSTMDDIIELYTKVGNSYIMVPGGSENESSGNSDFERMNISGLTVGTTYYISVGGESGSASGAYTLCVQNLMPSGCSTAIPVVGLNLCSSFKAIYRGAASQGVSYDFSFTGVTGATGVTSLTGTSGLIVLSNPTLALAYGATYDVAVNANYNLTNSAGIAELMTVSSSAVALCNDVQIMAQPNLEVRSSQRCPTTLFRGTYLGATGVTSSSICGATTYSFEFTQVVSCSDATVVSLTPSVFTTTSSSPYLQLGVLPNLPGTGAWSVRVRPNFGAVLGVFGPGRIISVSGTSASGALAEGSAVSQERSEVVEVSASIYPNPNSGSAFNVNFTDLSNASVQVRLIDAMGRVVYNKNYSVEGSLNQTITFDTQLASGIYMVELVDGNESYSQRMIVRN